MLSLAELLGEGKETDLQSFLGPDPVYPVNTYDSSTLRGY